MGTDTKPMPTNINMIPSIQFQSKLSIEEAAARDDERTTDDEAWRILGPENIRGDCTAEVAYTDMQGHTNSTLVLAGKVVTEPMHIVRHLFLSATNADKPANYTREARVGTSDAEEGAEVLHTRRGIGDVDCKANKEHTEPGEDERRTLLYRI